MMPEKGLLLSNEETKDTQHGEAIHLEVIRGERLYLFGVWAGRQMANNFQACFTQLSMNFRCSRNDFKNFTCNQLRVSIN